MHSVRLKDLLVTPVKNGYSPICVDDHTGKWVLGLGALNGNGIDTKEIKPVPEHNKKTAPYTLKKGDFLLSRSNTLDKVGRAALYRGGLENCSYPDLMMRFRVHEQKVFPDFLEEYLQSNISRRYFMRCAAGTSGSMVKITKSVVEKLIVNLPSLAEQKSIAEIANSNNEVIKKTEALIKAKECQFRWLQKNALDGDFKSYDSHLCDYAAIMKQQKIEKVGDLKPLTVKLHCKGIEANDRDMQITLSKKGRPYFQRFASEFLVGRQNFHNGGFGIVPERLNGFIASNAITTLDIDATKLDVKYLFYFFSRKDYYLRIGHIMDGTGQKELSDKQIMKLPVSIPSIEKQKEVVALLDTAQQEITLLKKLADQYRTQKRGLMQKLLSGQWRIDNG